MDVFRFKGEGGRELAIYPRGGIVEDALYLGVSGRPDWEGYHSTEFLLLDDEKVVELHEWLGQVIEDRK